MIYVKYELYKTPLEFSQWFRIKLQINIAFECKIVKISFLYNLQVCSASEFILLMEYLAASRFISTSSGQADYLHMCEEYAELDNPFEPLDVDKILTCTDFALPLFSVWWYYILFLSLLDYLIFVLDSFGSIQINRILLLTNIAAIWRS